MGIKSVSIEFTVKEILEIFFKVNFYFCDDLVQRFQNFIVHKNKFDGLETPEIEDFNQNYNQIFITRRSS